MKRIDFEKGTVTGNILNAAIPMLVAQILNLLYNIVDRIYIARIQDVGTTALGAVGLCFPIIMLITAFSNLFGSGGSPIFSINRGKGDSRTADMIMNTAFTMLCGSAAVLMLVGFLFARPLLTLFGASDDALVYAYPYLMIYLLGTLPSMIATGMNPFINAQGYAIIGMLSVAVGAVANIILDPIFIFVWNMGVAGAALATIISQLISFILLLAGIRISTCIPIRLKNLKHIKEHLLTIAGGGLPSLFRQGLASIATLALNLSANPFGDAAIAAMSIVGRITMFANSALIGFGQGFQPVCGYNYGAGKYKRVQEAFWFCVKVATGGLLIFSALGIVFAEPLVTIFRKDDPSVISIGSTALRMQCVTFTLGGWVLMNNMLMQTIGKTMRASILAAARQGLFFLPAILILPYFLQLTGIQLAQPVADVFAFFLAVILNRRTMKELAHPIERTQSI